MVSRPSKTRFSSRELLAAGALLGGLVVLLYAVPTQRMGLRTDDAGQYVRMAESPSYSSRLPYTFRVLTPLLAGAWPSDAVLGFTLVTLGSLILAAVALYAYQRLLGLGRPTAIAGAALFACSGGAVRMLTTPTYVDAATYLSEGVAFLSLAYGGFAPFAGAVVLGVANRETALLLVPLAFFAAPIGWGARKAWAVAVLAVGVLGGVVLIRLWATGLLDGAVALATIAPAERAMRQQLPTRTDLFDLFSTFGMLWLLALKNLPGPTRLQRRALAFGGLVVAQLVVARGDEGRVLSHLFVIVIPLAMIEVEAILASGARHRQALAGALVLGCAASMVNARWTLFEPAMLRYAIVGVGCVVAVAVMATGLWARRNGLAPRGLTVR